MQVLLAVLTFVLFWSIKLVEATNDKDVICKPVIRPSFAGNLICKQSNRHKWYFLDNYWSGFNEITNLTLINPSKVPNPVLNLSFTEVHYDLQHLTITNMNLKSFNGIQVNKLVNLNRLNLTHNEISELPEKLFLKNIELRVIDLSHNKIKQIADNLFERNQLNEMLIELKRKFQEKVKYLYSSDDTDYHDNSDYRNRKYPVDEFPFKSINDYTSLTELYLHSNELPYIKYSWFENIPNLKILTLQNNGIRELNGNMFIQNRNLLQLNINNNKLIKVSNISNAYFSSLKLFDVSNNSEIENLDLKKLNVDTLLLSNAGVTECAINSNVRILKANANKIVKVTMHGTGHILEELHLAHNQLINMPNITELTNLVFLDLSHNFIETIHENDLRSLTNLKDLKLDHNQISSIHYQSFGNQMSLMHLNLSRNHLNDFHVNFSAAVNLLVLDISGNNLTSLDPNIKQQAVNLREILLSDNLWDCDNLMNLSLLLSSGNIDITGSENPNGIKCHRKDNNLVDGKSNAVKNVQTMDKIIADLKKDVEQMIDFKIQQLEKKLKNLILNLI